MTRNNRRNRHHPPKNSVEREEYARKVKHAFPESATKSDIANQSTIYNSSAKSNSMEEVGVADRNQIKPPKQDNELLKWIGIVAGILTVLVFLGTLCIWFTTLKNQVAFNEREISQCNQDIKGMNSKRESMSARIIILEQCQKVMNDDLKQIKVDIKNDVPTEQIDLKLSLLEQKLLKEIENSQSKVGLEREE